MAKTTLSLSLPFDPHKLTTTNNLKPRKSPLLSPFKHHHKFDRYILSCSHSSSPTTTKPTFFNDPYRPNTFLTDKDIENLKKLETFEYVQTLESGSLFICVMRADEIETAVKILAEGFAESMMFFPEGYVKLLGFLVKQYLIERRGVMPHAVTLIGFYREKGDEGGDLRGEECLAGTVEVSFDKNGANASLPTPVPPRDRPYICNMTVRKSLRRRGIGWHLLKASEQLISQMSSSREVYLHCRMIDIAPCNMYLKAGYSIVKTDNILILLTLQRRKHLMRKELPALDNTSDSDVQSCNDELTS